MRTQLGIGPGCSLPGVQFVHTQLSRDDTLLAIRYQHHYINALDVLGFSLGTDCVLLINCTTWLLEEDGKS